MLAESRGGFERSEGGLDLLNTIHCPHGRGGLQQRDHVQAVPEYHMDIDTHLERTQLGRHCTRKIWSRHSHGHPTVLASNYP